MANLVCKTVFVGKKRLVGKLIRNLSTELIFLKLSFVETPHKFTIARKFIITCVSTKLS